VTWNVACDAGVVNREKLLAKKERMSDAAGGKYCENRWVNESEYKIQFTVESGEIATCTRYVYGVDPNANPGHAWVKVGLDGDNRVHVVAEGVINDLQAFSAMETEWPMYYETNALGSVLYKEARKYNAALTEDYWSNASKNDDIDRMKVLSDRRRLFVHESCHDTIKALKDAKFKRNGEADKGKSGKLVHFFDCVAHATKITREGRGCFAGGKVERMNFNR
jgi:hypothetical protein